jgi:hypothetical protein
MTIALTHPSLITPGPATAARNRPRALSCPGRLRRWLRTWVPSVTSHHQAMEELADGYEAMARRCIARGDIDGASLYGHLARALRGQIATE